MLVCIIGSAAWGILSISEISETLNDRSSSGIDFFMMGVGCSIGLFALGTPGLVLSVILGKLNAAGAFKTVSRVGIVLFSAELLFAGFVFFI